jgi:hypothetical protein
MRLLLGEELAHAAGALGWTESLGGIALTPGERLHVEVIEVAETARGEEGVANETNSALDSTLLIASPRRDRPGLETIVGSQLEQCGVKADCLAHALEHRTLKIVVEGGAGNTLEIGKRLDMSADEVAHRGAEIETQEQMPGVGEHHHEGHQRTLGTTDDELAEMRPIDLRLFAGKRA